MGTTNILVRSMKQASIMALVDCAESQVRSMKDNSKKGYSMDMEEKSIIIIIIPASGT
jgi:hypothetical protein